MRTESTSNNPSRLVIDQRVAMDPTEGYVGWHRGSEIGHNTVTLLPDGDLSLRISIGRGSMDCRQPREVARMFALDILAACEADDRKSEELGGAFLDQVMAQDPRTADAVDNVIGIDTRGAGR